MASKCKFYCSFCGRTEHEVRTMIAGPTVFICNECVADCVTIIARLKNRGITKPSKPATAGPDK